MSEIALIFSLLWIYYLLTRLFYLQTFLKTLMALMELLVKIEKHQQWYQQRDILLPIYQNAIYKAYSKVYRMYVKDEAKYYQWAKRTARWSFILFPIHLYSYYRIIQLINKIEGNE